MCKNVTWKKDFIYEFGYLHTKYLQLCVGLYNFATRSPFYFPFFVLCFMVKKRCRCNISVSYHCQNAIWRETAIINTWIHLYTRLYFIFQLLSINLYMVLCSFSFKWSICTMFHYEKNAFCLILYVPWRIFAFKTK